MDIIMIKKEWDYEGNEGNEMVNQGKTPQQMESSYIGAFIAFVGLGILLIGSVIWELIKNW